MIKKEVHITNWSTGNNFFNPYQTPETTGLRLYGISVDHPFVEPGHRLVSSQIVKLDLKNRRVETENTVFILDGPPDEAWIKFLQEINYDMSKLPE